MSPDPLPEPWRSALEPKGVRSKRGLATKAGIAPQTAKRLIDGEGRPSPETVTAVADALFAGDRNRVWELAGQSRQDFGDWQLPREASQLNPEQRAAVLAIVRAMLPPESGRGDGDVDRDAPSMNEIREKAAKYDRLMGQGPLVEIFSKLNTGVSLTKHEVDAAVHQLEAARTERSVGRSARRAQDEEATGSQDPGGIESA